MRPSRTPRAWARGPAALAIVLTGLPAVLVAVWFVVTGTWTFLTADYGTFAGTVALAALLIGSPVVAFRLAARDRPGLALTATAPALLLYGVLLIVLSR